VALALEKWTLSREGEALNEMQRTRVSGAYTRHSRLDSSDVPGSEENGKEEEWRRQTYGRKRRSSRVSEGARG